VAEHKQEEAFRVIDRRPFTAEGDLRKEVVEEEEREAKREAAKHPAATSRCGEGSGPTATAGGHPRAHPRFRESCPHARQQRRYGARRLRRPRTGQPMIDPEAARELIDMLDALHEKTKGNLAPEEDTLLWISSAS